ncbi:MAG TPA: phospholipase D-like domain-containing protein [Kofleriaceae bacterium]|nr:phospholipase D-like domain-containing protein [Kofleriaceae bacterium]
MGAAPADPESEGPDDDGSEVDADALADASPAPAVGTPFSIGGIPGWVHFTNPAAHAGHDTNIIRETIRLIDATPKGETIHAAIHSLVLNNVVTALVAAKQRGVTVLVAEDGSDEFDADDSPRQLAAALGANHVFCGDRRANGNFGCITTDSSGIMHTKLMTFSKTAAPDGTLRTNVTWFGSANMTHATGENTFNNTITIYGDTELYTKLDKYFMQLFQQKHFANNDYYNADADRGFVVSPTTRIYLSPEQDSDLIKNRLNDIVPGASCEVRAAQAMIFDSRPDLIDQLIRVKKGGCLVRVATGHIQSQSLARLKAANISVKHAKLHDKYVLVDAKFADSTARRTIVFTGSHNWTKSANYANDELFSRLEDQAVYDAFLAHFRAAFESGTAP